MASKKTLDDSIETAMHEHENPAVHSNHAVWESRDTYCEPGFRGLLMSYYVALCAAFSALGGLLFGYDQGVVSVILVVSLWSGADVYDSRIFLLLDRSCSSSS